MVYFKSFTNCFDHIRVGLQKKIVLNSQKARWRRSLEERANQLLSKSKEQVVAIKQLAARIPRLPGPPSPKNPGNRIYQRGLTVASETVAADPTHDVEYSPHSSPHTMTPQKVEQKSASPRDAQMIPSPILNDVRSTSSTSSTPGTRVEISSAEPAAGARPSLATPPNLEPDAVSSRENAAQNQGLQQSPDQVSPQQSPRKQEKPEKKLSNSQKVDKKQTPDTKVIVMALPSPPRALSPIRRKRDEFRRRKSREEQEKPVAQLKLEQQKAPSTKSGSATRDTQAGSGAAVTGNSTPRNAFAAGFANSSAAATQAASAQLTPRQLLAQNYAEDEVAGSFDSAIYSGSESDGEDGQQETPKTSASELLTPQQHANLSVSRDSPLPPPPYCSPVRTNSAGSIKKSTTGQCDEDEDERKSTQNPAPARSYQRQTHSPTAPPPPPLPSVKLTAQDKMRKIAALKLIDAGAVNYKEKITHIKHEIFATFIAFTWSFFDLHTKFGLEELFKVPDTLLDRGHIEVDEAEKLENILNDVEKFATLIDSVWGAHEISTSALLAGFFTDSLNILGNAEESPSPAIETDPKQRQISNKDWMKQIRLRKNKATRFFYKSDSKLIKILF